MSGLAIAVMVIVCGLVWGGFVLLLALALRHEGGRRGREGGAEPRD